MQYLLDHMELLNKFAYNDSDHGSGSKNNYAKIVPFASG
jgi:hypothetical protein